MYVLPTDAPPPPTGVCTGDSAVHADLIRGFPASAVQRTHGGTLPPLTPPPPIVAPPTHTCTGVWCVWAVSDPCFC